MSVKNTLVRVAEDVFINFYEIACIEVCDDDDESAQVVLKNGHKIVIENTTARAIHNAVRDQIYNNNTYVPSNNITQRHDY